MTLLRAPNPKTPTATPEASRPRLRDDRARETRRRLVAAAFELATEDGWRRTTVERIAQRAGVAKGTFFVHFKTKESVVLALVERQIAAASAARDAVLVEGGSPVDALHVATMTLGRHAATNIELSRAVLIATLESKEVGGATDEVFSKLHVTMVADAREALSRGLLEGPDAETVAGLLMACYLGAALHCASAPSAKPLADVLAPLVDATIAALSPKKKKKAKRTTRASNGKGAPAHTTRRGTRS